MLKILNRLNVLGSVKCRTYICHAFTLKIVGNESWRQPANSDK